MTWIRARRGMAVFALGSLLGAPWCLAADTRPSAKKDLPGWVEIWTQVKGDLIGFWNEYGRAVDALGKASNVHASQSSQESAEIGCAVDPYGRCLQ